MSCTQYIDSIQELVDGTLGAIRRAELEQHLAGCEECRGLLADLQRIRDAAAALPAEEPPGAAWLQIAGRLRQEGRITSAAGPATRRAMGGMWWLAAAALVLAAGASLFVLSSRGERAPAGVNAAAPAGGGNAADVRSVQSVQNELEAAQQQYETAIGHLEQIAKANPQALDTQTARTLEKNIAITDMAIAESRAAVRSEPTSVAARESLFDALRQKAALLEQTVSLINEMRKGNNAGAAEVVNR